MGAALYDRRHFEKLHGYFSGRRSERDLDVAAFHDDDVEVFESPGNGELAFFRRARRGSGL